MQERQDDRLPAPRGDERRLGQLADGVVAALAPHVGAERPEHRLGRVLAELRPHVWCKGGDYAVADLPEARLIREWGGQAVILPFLRGRSTTSLITAARS